MRKRQRFWLLLFGAVMLAGMMSRSVLADDSSANNPTAVSANDPRSIFLDGCLARGRQNGEAPAYSDSFCRCSWNVVASNLTADSLSDMARFAHIYGMQFASTPEFARIKPVLDQCQGQATYSAIPTPPYPLARRECPMRLGSTQLPPGSRLLGRVASFVSRREVLAGITATERNIRGQLAPDYFDNRRVRLMSITTPYLFTIALVPASLNVQRGDYVEYTTVHPDPRKTCSYIPNIIDRVIPKSRG